MKKEWLTFGQHETNTLEVIRLLTDEQLINFRKDLEERQKEHAIRFSKGLIESEESNNMNEFMQQSEDKFECRRLTILIEYVDTRMKYLNLKNEDIF